MKVSDLIEIYDTMNNTVDIKNLSFGVFVHCVGKTCEVINDIPGYILPDKNQKV